jgi:hypothetical protein
MHISQFQPGDVIRHSKYIRGEGYATVVSNDSYPDEVVDDELVAHPIVLGTVTIQTKGGKKPTDIGPGNPTWDDSEWAHVTAAWFTDNGKRVPKALKEKLTPVDIVPDNGQIGHQAK